MYTYICLCKFITLNCRKQMWPQECLTIATRAVTTGTKRKLKDGTFSITLTEAFTFDMALEEAYLKKVTSGFSNSYPQYWYTFVAIGYPSGDCSPLLISGCPTKAMAMGLGPSCALLEGGRDARKQQHREMICQFKIRYLVQRMQYRHQVEIRDKGM